MLWRRMLSQSRPPLHFAIVRIRFLGCALIAPLFGSGFASAQQADLHADSNSLDFKQFGLLATQEGGRRKPVGYRSCTQHCSPSASIRPVSSNPDSIRLSDLVTQAFYRPS